MFIGWYFDINVLFLIMFKVLEFSGIFVSLGGLDKIFSDLVGDRRGGISRYPGWHYDVDSQYISVNHLVSFYFYIYGKKINLRSFKGV